MMPDAPARLSTTTCWPIDFVTPGAMIRAFTSTVPPGGNGEISRIARSGYFAPCAHAACVQVATSAIVSAPINALAMLPPPRFIRFGFGLLSCSSLLLDARLLDHA